MFVAFRNAGGGQQPLRACLQTTVTAGDAPLQSVVDGFPTRPFTQRTNLDRGLHTEVTLLTVHPGSEFAQGQKLAPLCTSCGVEEGAVDVRGKPVEGFRVRRPAAASRSSSREIGDAIYR